MPYYNILIEKLAASEGAETGYYSGLAVSVCSYMECYSDTTVARPIAQCLRYRGVHQHVLLGACLR